MLKHTMMALALSLSLASPASARPAVEEHTPHAQSGDPVAWPGGGGGVAGLSVTLFTDTVTYGGTVWAADSARWEAIRDGCWTFESGVGSSINTGGNPNKPIGYHQTMEGWYGIDQTLSPLPYFRRSSTCAVNGSFSYWAGVTTAEASALCYGGGQGYGNSWTLVIRKTFTYPGSGNASLSYKYSVEAEAGFDYTYVRIDTTGNGSLPEVDLAAYTGTTAGTAVHPLTRGSTLRSNAGPVTISFHVTSDGSYSDEDGLNSTACGHTAIDDITLSGAVTDFANFETGDDGWTQFIPATGIGDFSHLAWVGDLPPVQPSFCPCGTRDSVLVFSDMMNQHPLDQDNIAASPWIDLKRGGDAGRPLKLVLYSINLDLPLSQYVFEQVRARYYPAVCAVTGRIITTPWRDQNIVFFPGFSPYCTALGATQLRDYSAVVEKEAEQVQLGLGMLNLCRTAPFGVPCTGQTNTTPWFDNIALGVSGSAVAPGLALLTFDRFQDAFAADGTLNPSSTGRLDTNTIKNGSNPRPGTILRDTLVARVGSSTNTEVRIYFCVRTGPFTSQLALATQRAGRWTTAPWITPLSGAFGNTWYYARLDTAEQGGVVSSGNYMSTFHESDPGFQNTDRTPDPQDPSQLENEILPDRILTPGSRVDYFLAARYIPPDPRNVGGTHWFLEMDTTGRRFREVEILPSSMTADTSWNCVLYVDHHGDRSFDEARIEETGLSLALGGGGMNAEGTRYDRFDNETPSSGQLSFGREIQTNYGATVVQLFAYKALVWHSATLSSLALTDEDANVIRPWLKLGNGNRFWGTGDGLVRSMSTSGEASTVAFMKEILGVLAVCNTVRDAACPTGSALDSTSCLATGSVAGAHFATVPTPSVAANGCNALRSFDVNAVNGELATARGQLSYVKNGAPVQYLSVTNEAGGASGYRTVVDGAALGALRTTTATPHNLALCSADPTAAHERTAAVLGWFGAPLVCRTPQGVTDAPEPGPDAAPKFRTTLETSMPNPMDASTVIRFETARAGTAVRIEILDVAGRRVRTLVDAPFDAGRHDVVWDGTSDSGRSVAAGLYFYRMTADGKSEAKKVVVTR